MARQPIRDFDRLSSKRSPGFSSQRSDTTSLAFEVAWVRLRHMTFSNGPATGVGSVLRLIRDGEAVTRAELARRTGLARSTVAQRVDALLAHELVYEAGDSASTGGRPPTVLAFNHAAGVVLAADLGATHSRLAVSDLAASPLAELPLEIDIAAGPEAVLSRTEECFAAMLGELERTRED